MYTGRCIETDMDELFVLQVRLFIVRRADFLLGDKSLYWITGKAGAGKSTLMKYIYSEPRTLQMLQTWAAEKPLVWAKFFFWNSGTVTQMSQEGLLRTILYDVLVQRRDLVPMAFPQRMETLILLNSHSEKKVPWKCSELLRAFRLTIREVSKTMKLALFIDGLDELNGNHSELITLIQSIQKSSGIKICITSRPWTVFEDAFKHEPNLTLEELTFFDIKNYASFSLSNNPGFRSLQMINPNSAEDLILKVTTKASGVFLWVYLVVRSLLEGLSEGEKLSELHGRLNSLPADLEKLFWRILHQLDDVHLRRGMRLFSIVADAIQPLTVLELSYADDDSQAYPFDVPVGPLTDTQRAAKAEMMRRRLNVCTKGLLEATPSTALKSPNDDIEEFTQKRYKVPLTNSLVGYLHRTVRDFMVLRDTRRSVAKELMHPFNANFHLCSIYIVLLKTTMREKHHVISSGPGKWFWDQVTYGIEYAVRADPSATGLQFRLLEEIDHAAGSHFRNEGHDKAIASGNTIQNIKWHWAEKHPNFRYCTSFLQFAVQCQLVDYVETKLIKDPEIFNKCQDPYPLLYYALTRYEVFWGGIDRPTCSHACPSVKLIRILLKHGADPNSKVGGKKMLQIARENSRSDGGNEWEEIMRLFNCRTTESTKKSKKRSRLLDLFRNK